MEPRHSRFRIRREKLGGKILAGLPKTIQPQSTSSALRREIFACENPIDSGPDNQKIAQAQGERRTPTCYSSDFGSDLFFGEALVSSESSMLAAAGLATFPSRKISLAVSLRP